jgi:cytochrome c556
MRTYLLLLPATLLLLVACTAPQPAAQPQGDYRINATLKDIMDSMVDPGADYIWESVATTVSEKGIEEKLPRTDEEWTQVRRHAIMLQEAANLLLMPGRRVAEEGVKSENPNIELEPHQIEALINGDRKSFVDFAHALQDTVTPVLKAVDAKDAEGLLNAGDGIDRACENCHLKYWYPEEAKQRDLEEKQRQANPRKP